MGTEKTNVRLKKHTDDIRSFSLLFSFFLSLSLLYLLLVRCISLPFSFSDSFQLFISLILLNLSRYFYLSLWFFFSLVLSLFSLSFASQSFCLSEFVSTYYYLTKLAHLSLSHSMTKLAHLCLSHSLTKLTHLSQIHL